MIFIERIRKLLLERNYQEIEAIKSKISEMTEQHWDEYQNFQTLKEELKNASKDKTTAQRAILNRKELEDLETIYEFIANYQVIEKILNKIKKVQVLELNPEYIYFDNEQDLKIAEMNRRRELYEVVKKLNSEIIKIINGQDEPSQSENKKQSFLAKLFKSKSKEAINFKKFERTIIEFEQKYNSFLVADFVDFSIIDKKTSLSFATRIHQFSVIKNRGGELFPEEEEFLTQCQPHEFWQEVLNYYSKISDIEDIVKKFGANLERYQKLYEDNPELFDLNNLDRIFRENNQKIVALKDRKQNAEKKQREVAKQRESEKELKEKLRILEEKKRKLIEKRDRIQNARTLNELGFKNKEDAVKKLSLESKDYLVIPIANTISKISELFGKEKQIRIEVDGKSFLGVYSNDIVEARINTITEEKNTSSCLFIPISELRKEDIDSIKAGKIFLNKSVLQLKNLLLMTPDGRQINLEGTTVKTQNYTYGTISEQVRIFLGEDYLKESDSIFDYDIFKGIPNVSSREKRSKREAVKKSICGNIRRDIVSTDSILVNGKPYFLNKDDENEIRINGQIQPLNEMFLINISDEIENYLIDGEDRGAQIDQLYAKLLLEYMKIDPKARADYYDEEHTTISLKDKKISIKPILPAKDEKIAKRYSRHTEDVVYKTMKLAALINKFAHLSTSKEVQDTLYEVKQDLIERTIDLAKDTPNVKLKRNFDDKKMAMSVVLEIPGYNMIALHLINKTNALTYKSNKLEESDEKVLQSSAILMPGVNSDFLNAMKNMTEAERMELLVNLDSETFLKLILRMGYTSDSISTEEKRKSFIQNMISDKMINKLIKENQEQERD